MKAGHGDDTQKRNKTSTVSWIRTNDLPIRERVNLGNLSERANLENVGYRIGCADHCTTTAFLAWLMETEC